MLCYIFDLFGMCQLSLGLFPTYTNVNPASVLCSWSMYYWVELRWNSCPEGADILTPLGSFQFRISNTSPSIDSGMQNRLREKNCRGWAYLCRLAYEVKMLGRREEHQGTGEDASFHLSYNCELSFTALLSKNILSCADIIINTTVTHRPGAENW